MRLIRDVASYLNIRHTNTSFWYLCNKVKYLDSTKLHVTLQLDEIHIKPKISYDSGQLYGNASNRDQQQANRIQKFMIENDIARSIYYNFGSDKNVTAGYRIVAIISDNNIINRKMFIKLSGSDSLVPYIVNPVNQIDRIYRLFVYLIQFTC